MIKRWLKERFWPPLKQAFINWGKDDGSLMAAAVSYYMALSFFPLLLILTSALGFVLRFTGWGQDAQHKLLQQIAEQTSPTLANQVGDVLAGVESNALISGPIGVATLLFAAITIFAQFEHAFDRIWNVEQSGSGGFLSVVKAILTVRLRAFLMLLAIGALSVATFFADLVISAIAAMTKGILPLAWTFQTLSVVVIYWSMFTLIYKLLPKADVRWADAVQGAVLAVVIWEVGRQILAAYLIGDKYSAYGVIGSFIAIMLWVFYAISVLFLGAEYVQALHQRREQEAGGK